MFPFHPKRFATVALLSLTALLLSRAIRAADTPATAPADAQWKSLFDGKTLDKWVPVKFGGEGEVHVEDGALVIESGATLSGANYKGETPKMSYEVELDARRVEGSDFFCGLTVPVGDSHASLILGGWGGTLCGISSLDDMDAANNDTRTNMAFKKGQWYHVRLRVLPNSIAAWVDKECIINVETTGKKIGLRSEVEASKPFGLATYETTGAYKNIRVRPLTAKEIEEGKEKK